VIGRELKSIGPRRSARLQVRVASSTKKSFRSKRAWERLIRGSRSDLTKIDLLLRRVALNARHPFLKDAQNLIAHSWWQARGTVHEEYLYRLLIETKSIASHGFLRIITLLVHGTLPEYSVALEKWESDRHSHVASFIDELSQVFALENEWSLQLVDALAAAFACNTNLRDELANVAWETWVKVPSLRGRIRGTGRANQILPSGGRNLFLGASVLGPDKLLEVVTPQNVSNSVDAVLLLSDLDPNVSLSFEGLLRGAQREILDELWMNPLVGGDQKFHSQLINNPVTPSRSTIDEIWRMWDQTESADLYTVLVKWSTSFRRPSEDPANSNQKLFLESCLITGHASEFLSGDGDTDVLRLCQLGLEVRPTLKHLLDEYIKKPEFAQLRELICHRVSKGNDPDSKLTELCVRHKIAPDDEVQRSIFFLITDQVDELLLSDPDLESLGLAYLSAAENQREKIRKSLLNQPRLNLGNVLASVNRRERLVRLSEKELEYFVDQLFDRREFETLFEMSTNMSLAFFVYVCSKISSANRSWEPSDSELADLYREYRDSKLSLAMASLGENLNQSVVHNFLITGSSSVVETWRVEPKPSISNGWPVGIVRARIRFDGRINDLSFSPDGEYLAIAGTNKIVGELDLAKGSLSFVERRLNSSVGALFHLGSHRIVAAERTNRVDSPCRVLLVDNGHTIESLKKTVGSVTSLVGFGPTKLMFTGRDKSIGIIDLTDGVKVSSATNMIGDFPRLAAENSPLECNVVFSDVAHYVSLNQGMKLSRPLSMPSRAKRATWVSNSRVIQLDHGGRILTIDVDHPRQRLTLNSKISNAFFARDLALVASRNQVAILDEFNLTIVSASDLKKVGSLNIGGTSLHASPSGNLIAVGDQNGFVRIIDTSIGQIPSLISKPLLECTPREFQTCLGVYSSASNSSWTSMNSQLNQDFRMKEVLHFLVRLLRYRFRYDISIVDTKQIKGGEYDIALS
jgi:WD40 repeat protein